MPMSRARAVSPRPRLGETQTGYGALAALPVSGLHAPAVALAYPLVGDPVMSGMARFPVALRPFVSVADPAPITGQPYVPRRRRFTDGLDARRRRRNHDHPAGIMALIGSNHRGPQGHRQHEAAWQCRARSFALIHNGNHVLLLC